MKYSICLLCFSLFVSCSKDSSQVQNTLTYGVRFDAEGQNFLSSVTNGTSVAADDSTSMVIFGEEDNKTPALMFGITLYFRPQSLTHSFSNADCDSATLFYNSSQHLYTTANAFHLISAHIDNYDASTHFISGTFEGKLYKDGLTPLIPLTNGQFKMKIQ